MLFPLTVTMTIHNAEQLALFQASAANKMVAVTGEAAAAEAASPAPAPAAKAENAAPAEAPKAAPKAAPAAAAAAPAAAAQTGTTYEQVKVAALALAKAKGGPALVSLLQGLGVSKAPDLKPEQYGEALAQMEAAAA